MLDDNRFGFKVGDLDLIITVIQKYPEIEQTIIFGSRAKGNYKTGSDVDIALKGKIDWQIVSNLNNDLNEETTLPYMFDVLDYNSINNIALHKHIDRIGVVFYEREKALKQGWEIKKLGDLIFENKKSTIKVREALDKGKYIFFTSGEKTKKSDSFLVEDENIFIATGGKAVISYYNGNASYSTDTYSIKGIKSQCLTKFIYYLIMSNLEIIEKDMFRGATIKHLQKHDFRNILLYLPPLPEQQKIVVILNKTFSAIDQAKQHAEQNLKNAKELFNSYLQSIFSNRGDDWEDKNIGDICNLMTGGTPSSNKAEYYNNGKIRWLVSGDVNMIEIHDCKGRITELGLANSNTKFLPVNSVIIALNGQGKTRGTVAMLRTKATCNQSLVSIYPKDIEKLLPEFIFYNLKVRYQELRTITGDSGNDRRGLNMPLIRSISIPYPKSIQDQEKLIKTFSILSDKTKQLEAIYQNKLTKLEELKKSILQKAFNGNLIL